MTEYNDFIQIGLEPIMTDPILYMKNIYAQSVRIDRGILDLLIFDNTKQDRVKAWISDGDGGVVDTLPWTEMPSAELRSYEYYADVKWDGFKYDIFYKDLDQEGSMENIIAKMNSAQAEFYEAVRSYRIINALKNAAHASTDVTASAVWTSNDAKIALDIINAIQQLRENKVPESSIRQLKIIYPQKAAKWFASAMDIGGTQQILSDYIMRYIGTNQNPFIPYQPDIRNLGGYGDAEAKYDALGNDALVVVPGTAQDPLGTYFNRLTKPTTPIAQVHKLGVQGYSVYSWAGSAVLIRPDIKLFGSDISGSTVYSGKIVKIKNVIS